MIIFGNEEIMTLIQQPGGEAGPAEQLTEVGSLSTDINAVRLAVQAEKAKRGCDMNPTELLDIDRIVSGLVNSTVSVIPPEII